MEHDPTVYFLGEDVAAAGGVFKTTEGLLERFGPTARARHADLGAGDHRRRDGRGDERPAPDRRDHVQRLLRGVLGHHREPDREGPVHDERAGGAAARDPDRQRRRRPVRRAALAERGELGDGHPGPEGRRAVHARRHGGPVRRRGPRSRSRDRASSPRSCTRPRARCPTARSSTGSGTARVVRAGDDVTICALGAMVPKAVAAADSWPATACRPR